jgi:hypothetical protein
VGEGVERRKKKGVEREERWLVSFEKGACPGLEGGEI